jgi:Tol biopolymer transport system component
MTTRVFLGSGPEPGMFARAWTPLLVVSAVLALALVPALASAAVDDTILAGRAGGLPGVAANGDIGPRPAVSADGRFVAFTSNADNLSTEDNDSVWNVFVRDTQPPIGELPNTILVSRATGPSGAAANGTSFTPSISADGRFVAFSSIATNLSDEDLDLTRDIYVRDTLMDTTTLVSRADGLVGAAAATDSLHPSISATGAQIAFQSAADNLSLEDTDGTSDIFIRDTAAGTTTLASRAHGSSGAPGNGDSYLPSISANGQRVAFESDADNMASDDNDAVRNIYVRDPRFRSTWHISRTTALGFTSVGADGNSRDAFLSADGSSVAFRSVARNLSDVNATAFVGQIFERNIAGEKTALVSRANAVDGAPAEGASLNPQVSADGRYVAFTSTADNLSDQDGPAVDVFVRDTVDQRTALVSRMTGVTGAGASDSSFNPAISGSGLFVAFLSTADNLSAEDDDTLKNLFVRELAPGLPAPEVLPDLGSNDHSQHEGGAHTGADHSAAGHSPGAHGGAGGHAHGPSGGGTLLRGGILFADRTQDIDKLFVYVTIHEQGRIVLEGQVRVRGGVARTYRFRPVKRSLQPHLLRKMRLKLSRPSLRAVKRALRHSRLNVRVKLTAVGASGNRQVARRTIHLRP